MVSLQTLALFSLLSDSQPPSFPGYIQQWYISTFKSKDCSVSSFPVFMLLFVEKKQTRVSFQNMLQLCQVVIATASAQSNSWTLQAMLYS